MKEEDFTTVVTIMRNDNTIRKVTCMGNRNEGFRRESGKDLDGDNYYTSFTGEARELTEVVKNQPFKKDKGEKMTLKVLKKDWKLAQKLKYGKNWKIKWNQNCIKSNFDSINH